jgi:hypothetical protein
MTSTTMMTDEPTGAELAATILMVVDRLEDEWPAPLIERLRLAAWRLEAAAELEAEIERVRGSKVTTWTAADRAEVARRAASGGEDR